jgi:hypothetical protein
VDEGRRNADQNYGVQVKGIAKPLGQKHPRWGAQHRGCAAAAFSLYRRSPAEVICPRRRAVSVAQEATASTTCLIGSRHRGETIAGVTDAVMIACSWSTPEQSMGSVGAPLGRRSLPTIDVSRESENDVRVVAFPSGDDLD